MIGGCRFDDPIEKLDISNLNKGWRSISMDQPTCYFPIVVPFSDNSILILKGMKPITNKIIGDVVSFNTQTEEISNLLTSSGQNDFMSIGGNQAWTFRLGGKMSVVALVETINNTPMVI